MTKEEWLMPGAVVPVDPDTTKALVDEIKRLIGVVGGMALQARSAPVQEPVAWFKHGPYEDGEPLSVVFENPHDDVCYSPLGFIDTPPAAQPAPVQEPVAWTNWRELAGAKHYQTPGWEMYADKRNPDDVALYTTPPAAQRQWVGLTDEDYKVLREGVVKQGKPIAWMIEQIEAKLKEKNT